MPCTFFICLSKLVLQMVNCLRSVSVYVCDSLILLGFVHRACSTHVAMGKIKPRTNHAALSAKEEWSSLLPLLAPHWCKDSRSPFSWIYEMLTSCFILSPLLRSMCVFIIFILYHRSREVLDSLWSHSQPTTPSHLTSLACVHRTLRRGGKKLKGHSAQCPEFSNIISQGNRLWDRTEFSPRYAISSVVTLS